MKFVIILLIAMLWYNGACVKAQQHAPENVLPKAGKSEPIVVGQKFKLYSKTLGETKEIYLALPPKYNERTHSYPVIVVLEAEYLFEVTTAATKLIQERSKMPQSIIVGIANGTYEKRNEMAFPTHGGKTQKYLKFLKNELIPYIDKNYRANAFRTIIGLSPTNGLLFDAFWLEPGLFRNYIALATHWEWNPEKGKTMADKFIETIRQPNYPKATIYMGTADGDMRYSEKQYKAAIQKLAKQPKTAVTYLVDLLKGEEHYLMTLAGIRNGFKLVYPDKEWGFPQFSDFKNPVQNLKQHYDRLSKKYGFDIYPIEDGHNYGGHLAGVAHNFARWSRYSDKQTVDLLELSVGYYPNSANLHRKLAKAYKKTGQTKLAHQTARKAVQLAAKYHPDKLERYKKQLQGMGL